MILFGEKTVKEKERKKKRFVVTISIGKNGSSIILCTAFNFSFCKYFFKTRCNLNFKIESCSDEKKGFLIFNALKGIKLQKILEDWVIKLIIIHSLYKM